MKTSYDNKTLRKLEQLPEYQIFIVLDPGEDIPPGFQKIPHDKLTIPCNLLRTIQIRWNSIQILEKKFQRIFLLNKGQELA
jgi:hypothetical protein